jgi:signal transduction histidine kinase
MKKTADAIISARLGFPSEFRGPRAARNVTSVARGSAGIFPRELPPMVRDEVYRIAVEAIRNSFRHAEAGEIEIDIRYDPRQFRLRVRDDAKGIDQAVLSAGGRSGHHGLPGMHERAGLAGGKLAVWSKPDAGTAARS